jgi:hypothetical protein
MAWKPLARITVTNLQLLKTLPEHIMLVELNELG